MGQERYCLAGREFSVNLDFKKGGINYIVK